MYNIKFNLFMDTSKCNPDFIRTCVDNTHYLQNILTKLSSSKLPYCDKLLHDTNEQPQNLRTWQLNIFLYVIHRFVL